ncbi:hypothetical protein BGI37_08460 [Snodgrassella alvi]|jgi:hypothetical protein|nr:hypothetical protein BGI37_08460 [Snodgrassella alvi]
MTNKQFYADAPVSSKEEDKFSRWKFAKAVADVIAKREDSSGLVIGLYGVWGNGKTSVLNFIQESLESEEKVICIKFNPWRYGTENDLLKGFFFTIAKALNIKLITKFDKCKSFIKKNTAPVASIVNMEGLGNIISSFITPIDTDELKKRIEKKLGKAQKRVLILIDDVDRLDKAEIQLLFKIVKLISDFKYTAYILAFDKDIVASALQDRYAGTNHNAGEAFLEKIIQIPLHLPPVHKGLLQQICYDGINSALAVAEIELTERQIIDFIDCFSTFDEQLYTPRRAKLYGNALLFSLTLLKEEVYPVDLMIIESVRIFYPSLYETIRNHKIFFTETIKNHETETAKKKIGDIINPALDVPHINKEKIIKLLMKLFPNNKNEIFEYSGQRICSPDYFSKYFLYSVPNDEVADSTISSFLSNLVFWQSPFNKDENPLDGLIHTYNIDNIIQKLSSKANSISSDVAYPLVIAIAQKSALIPNSKTLSRSSPPLAQFVTFTNELIQKVEQYKREALVLSCLGSAPSLEYKVKLFLLLSSEDRERPEKERIPDKFINQLGITLGHDIKRNHMQHNEDITLRYNNTLFDIFYILHKYVDNYYVNDYVRKLIARDRMAIIRLLTACWPAELDEAGQHKTDFIREKYNSLVKIIDVSVLIKSIKENFPHLYKNIPDAYPSKNQQENQNEGELLIQLFLYLHKHPEKYSSME